MSDKDRANGGPALFKRWHHGRSSQSDERPETLVGLRNIARRQRWVLEGTYYADTGEAPATTAVFGRLQESEKCSELLRGQPSDAAAVKEMWQGLTNRDISLFVSDAGDALQKLRDKAKNFDEQEPG